MRLKRALCWLVLISLCIGCEPRRSSPPRQLKKPATRPSKPLSPPVSRPPLKATQPAVIPAEPAPKPAQPVAPRAMHVRPAGMPPQLKPHGILAMAGSAGLGALARAAAEIKVSASGDPVAVSAARTKTAARNVRRMRRALARELGLRRLDWLQTSSPIRLVVMSPGKFNGGRAFILPLSDAKAVLASIPRSGRRPKGRHAAHFVVGERGVYVDLFEAHAIFSGHDGLFEALKPHLGSVIRSWTPTHPLTIQVDMAMLRTLYGADLTRQRGALRDSLVELFRLQRLPGTEEFLSAALDVGLGLVASTEELQISLRVRGSAFEFDVAIRDRKGEMSRLLGAKATRFAKTLVPTAWLGGLLNIPLGEVEAFKRFQRASVGIMTALFRLKTAEQQELRALMDKTRTNDTGVIAFSAFERAGFPFAFSSLKKVVDGKVALRTDEQIFDFIFVRASAWLKGRAQKSNPIALALAQGSFAGFLTALNRYISPLGLTVRRITRREPALDVRGLEVAMDWSKAVNYLPAAKFKKHIGNVLQLALAYGSERVAFAFGPSAVRQAATLVKGPFTGGQPAVTSSGRDHALVVDLRLGALIAHLAPLLPPASALGKLVRRLPTDAVLALRGKSDGSFVRFRVSVSASLIRKLKE